MSETNKTEPQTNPDDRHYAAIGKLVNSFCGAEVALASLFRDLVGLPVLVSMALSGDGKATSTIGLIRTIFPMIRPNEKHGNLIGNILDDLNKVKQIRDVLAHFVFGTSDNTMTFFNGFTSKDLTGRQINITIDELKECAETCGHLAAMLRLLYVVHPHTPAQAPEFHNTFTQMNDNMIEAWHKKRISLSKIHQRLTANPQKPKSQKPRHVKGLIQSKLNQSKP